MGACNQKVLDKRSSAGDLQAQKEGKSCAEVSKISVHEGFSFPLNRGREGPVHTRRSQNPHLSKSNDKHNYDSSPGVLCWVAGKNSSSRGRVGVGPDVGNIALGVEDKKRTAESKSRTACACAMRRARLEKGGGQAHSPLWSQTLGRYHLLANAETSVFPKPS